MVTSSKCVKSRFDPISIYTIYKGWAEKRSPTKPHVYAKVRKHSITQPVGYMRTLIQMTVYNTQ
jgi:hypothetical protein